MPALLQLTCVCSPCEAAAEAAYACMNRANYNRQECLDYFQAYRDCKGTWVSSRVSLQNVGIHLSQIQQRKDDRKAGRPTK